MEASLEAKEIRAVAEGEEDQATTVAETNRATTEEEEAAAVAKEEGSSLDYLEVAKEIKAAAEGASEASSVARETKAAEEEVSVDSSEAKETRAVEAEEGADLATTVAVAIALALLQTLLDTADRAIKILMEQPSAASRAVGTGQPHQTVTAHPKGQCNKTTRFKTGTVRHKVLSRPTRCKTDTGRRKGRYRPTRSKTDMEPHRAQSRQTRFKTVTELPKDLWFNSKRRHLTSRIRIRTHMVLPKDPSSKHSPPQPLSSRIRTRTARRRGRPSALRPRGRTLEGPWRRRPSPTT